MRVTATDPGALAVFDDFTLNVQTSTVPGAVQLHRSDPRLETPASANTITVDFTGLVAANNFLLLSGARTPPPAIGTFRLAGPRLPATSSRPSRGRIPREGSTSRQLATRPPQAFTTITSNLLQAHAGIYTRRELDERAIGVTVLGTNGSMARRSRSSRGDDRRSQRARLTAATRHSPGVFTDDAGGPAGWNLRLNRRHPVAGQSQGFADLEFPTPEQRRPWHVCWSGSTDDWVAITFGLRPA